MPSFLDLLQSSSGDEPNSSASGAVPLDVLASVKTEGGRRRRRRHRRNLAISGLGLVALAVPALALAGGDDSPEEVRSADVADDERGAATTSTTDPTEVAGVVIERTPEEAAAETTTTARPRPTTPPTTPPLVCSNSVDPACGDFSWSPEPGPNGEITPTVVGQTTVPAGETLDFDVVWSDPDAVPSYTDDDTDGAMLASACTTEVVRYGPWTPPAAAGGSLPHHVTFIAPAEPGTYEVRVYASSRNGDCVYDHYGSEGSTTVFIEVTPAS